MIIKPLRAFLLLCGSCGLAAVAAADFPSAGATNAVQQSVPAGYETFFPAGYTAPKMSVGNGAVAIVSPTPFFRQQGFGSSAGVRSTQVGATGQGSGLPLLQDGNTELMLAAATGDVEKARQLIGKGANVNTRNRFGSTALMGAAAGGHTEIVAMLLKKGASTNSKGKGGATALMFAAKNGHMETVTALLNGDADAGLRDNEGQTAAALAAGQGFSEIAELLKNLKSKKNLNPFSP